MTQEKKQGNAKIQFHPSKNKRVCGTMTQAHLDEVADYLNDQPEQKDRQLIHVGQYIFHLTEEELEAYNKILREHPEYEENDQRLLQALAIAKDVVMQNSSQK